MKKLHLLLILILVVSSIAATTFNVRNNPQQGEFASIREALEQVTNTTVLTERDIIDVQGIFTDTIKINKSVIIRGHGISNTILQAYDSKQDPAALTDSAGVISITGGANVDILNLTVRYGIDKFSIGGGGISIVQNVGGIVYLEGLEIAYNHSSKHSGAIASIGSNLTMKNCYIHHNTTTGQGGAMNIVSNNGGDNSNVLIQGCTFAYNSTTNNSGGAIAVEGNGTFGNNKKLNVVIENSTIVFNESGATGAGISAKGTIYTGVTPNENTNTTLRLNHCTIARNRVKTFGTNTLGVGLSFANVANGFPNFSIYNSVISQNEVWDGTANKNDANFNKSAFEKAINTIIGYTFALSNASVSHNSIGAKTDALKLDTELRFINNSLVPVLPLLEGSFAIDYCTENEHNIPIAQDQSGLLRSGNADAGSSEYAVQSSLSKLSHETVRLVNNPVINSLRFQSAETTIDNVTLYSVTGTCLLSQKYNQEGIDVSGFSKGVYLAIIKCGDGQNHLIRFIKN